MRNSNDAVRQCIYLDEIGISEEIIIFFYAVTSFGTLGPDGEHAVHVS